MLTRKAFIIGKIHQFNITGKWNIKSLAKTFTLVSQRNPSGDQMPEIHPAVLPGATPPDSLSCHIALKPFNSPVIFYRYVL